MNPMNENVLPKSEKLFKKICSGLKPPEDLTVSQWAGKHRRLSSETAAEPGAWRNSRTPYLVEVMDAFTQPEVKHIVLVAASQVGKTESELNIFGYVVDQDPSSVLWIFPTTIDAKEFSKMRIAPMIRDCKTLKSKIGDTKSRDANNTTLQKTYPGGILTLCGSTEAHALASKPIKIIIGDEMDRWAISAGEEGDPWDLAMARQTTFYNAKSIAVSTPTIKNASKIDSMYRQGTLEHWKTECPHCHEYNEIQWDDLRYTYDVTEINNARTYNVTEIHYVCPSCGAISDEHTMKNQPSRWVADNPGALADNGTRSFWLNAFVSRWATWESIIQKFLAAMNDPSKLQVVFNTAFGKLWENRGDLQDEEGLMSRREDYGVNAMGEPIELPEGVLVLTCGIDTQDDRLEYEVVGYGHFGESWGIKKGIILGRPDTPEVWQELDKVLDHKYKFYDGIGLKISRSFMDEGGHFTHEVIYECAKRNSKQLFAVKGSSKNDVPYVDLPRQIKVIVNKKYYGQSWHYIIGTGAGKQIIMDNLKVETPGANYCHFPNKPEYGARYFAGLLSERSVFDKAKRNMVWEKIPGHERNEVLDCRNYSLAAVKSMTIDFDEIENKIRAARARIKGEPTPRTQQTVIKKTVHKNKTTVKNWGEEW